MPNIDPTAVIELSENEIQLPNKTITASMAESYDTDKDGNHVVRKNFRYEWQLDGRVVSNEIETTIELAEEGDHVITGKVTDNKGLFGIATETVKVKPEAKPVNTTSGVWGNGDNISQKKVDQLLPLIAGNGWRPRFDMASFWPQENVFNRKYITDQLDLLRANGLVAGVMLFTGDNMPQWQFVPIGTDTALDGKFQSVRTDRGIYPYYEDLNYEVNVKKGWAEFFDILNDYKDVVSYFIPTVGSTGDIGDAGGYKGDPENPKYEISREWWTGFTKKMWQWAHDNCPVNIGINPGNNGEYFEWVAETLTKVTDMKQGNFTHEYDKPNDRLQWQRMQQYPQYRYFGEMEGDAPTSQQGVTAIVFQSAHVGMNVINVAPDKAIYEGLKFANTYLGTENKFWYPHSRKGTVNDITEPYARGIAVSGGIYGKNDGSGTFGLFNWSGIGVISAECERIRVWYKDGAGTLKIGSSSVAGKGTNKEVLVDLPFASDIKSDLLVYLIEGLI